MQDLTPGNSCKTWASGNPAPWAQLLVLSKIDLLVGGTRRSRMDSGHMLGRLLFLLAVMSSAIACASPALASKYKHAGKPSQKFETEGGAQTVVEDDNGNLVGGQPTNPSELPFPLEG